MTDPLKVNQSDRDARARALLMRIANERTCDVLDESKVRVVSIGTATQAMLAFAQAEVGCVPEGEARFTLNSALRPMVVEQIEREGSASSFMIRSGYLLQIIDALVTPEAQS